MRALGYSYHRAAATLKSFDRYVLTHAGRQRTLPLAKLLRGWLSRRSGRKAVSVAMDLGTLRQFFRYRRRFHPDGFIPGPSGRRRRRNPTSFPTFSRKTRFARCSTKQAVSAVTVACAPSCALSS